MYCTSRPLTMLYVYCAFTVRCLCRNVILMFIMFLQTKNHYTGRTVGGISSLKLKKKKKILISDITYSN